MGLPLIIAAFTAVTGAGSVIYQRFQTGKLKGDFEDVQKFVGQKADSPTQTLDEAQEAASDAGNWLHNTAMSTGEFLQSPVTKTKDAAQELVDETVANTFGASAKGDEEDGFNWGKALGIGAGGVAGVGVLNWIGKAIGIKDDKSGAMPSFGTMILIGLATTAYMNKDHLMDMAGFGDKPESKPKATIAAAEFDPFTLDV